MDLIKSVRNHLGIAISQYHLTTVAVTANKGVRALYLQDLGVFTGLPPHLTTCKDPTSHHGPSVMPRQPRLDLAGLPQHVVQRGNNRQPCFLREQDYRCYLQLLLESTKLEGCLVEAELVRVAAIRRQGRPRKVY